jgi:hypothetical protein
VLIGGRRRAYGSCGDHRHALQRILALTAAIRHNDHTDQPTARSLVAHDH